MTTSWSGVPCLSIAPPHCPFCRSLRPITVRSVANGDGSTTRYSVCRQCSQRFLLIVELDDSCDVPYFGNGSDGV